MKILRASFLGVRGVADGTLDFSDARSGNPNRLVVFTGPRGSGKTRTLEAILAAKEALGPYGLPPQGAAWVGAGRAAKISLSFALDPSEVEYAGVASPWHEAEVIFRHEDMKRDIPDGLRALLERYSPDRAHGKVDYMPANRWIPPHPPYPGLGAMEQRIYRITKDVRKYGAVISLLRALEQDPAKRVAFATRLRALCPARAYEPVATEPPTRCFRGADGELATALEVSAGEADGIMLAATAVVVGLDHSILAIDRPDLHNDDPAALLRGLDALGEDNQLLLTGGPALAAEAALPGRAGCVIALRSGPPQPAATP